MTSQKRKNGAIRVVKLPPHPNADIQKKMMEDVRKMTPEEAFQLGVRAGVYHPDGTLTKAFGGPTKGAKKSAKAG